MAKLNAMLNAPSSRPRPLDVPSNRVFYTAIGHRAEHYWNPTLLQFYLDGIQFATGDLKAPTNPSQPPRKSGDRH